MEKLGADKPYARPKLCPYDPATGNKVFPFPAAPPADSGIVSGFVKKGYYYGYNSESVMDFGWGCAWRCIQMLLRCELCNTAQESLMPSFENLFLNFGSKSVLVALYQKLHSLPAPPACLQERKFAPHDLTSGWAEPFIGQLVLSHFGFPHSLIAVNGIPTDALAPEEAFSAHVQSWKEFVGALLDHFSHPSPTPVMIDDASYAYCIIGLQVTSENNHTRLWIADPHSGANVGAEPVGLYWVELDPAGKQVASSVPEERRPRMYANGCDTQLSFEEKGWMALV